MTDLEKSFENLYKTLTIKKIEVPELGLTERMKESIVQALIKEIKENFNKYNKELLKKLSDPLPKIYRHRKRPQNRLFPFKDYLNKDNDPLTESYKQDLQVEKINLNHYRFTIDVGFDSPHAYYTNEGIAGKVKSTGKWVGWLTDMLRKEGRQGVPSAVQVNNKIFNAKKINTLIQMYLGKG